MDGSESESFSEYSASELDSAGQNDLQLWCEDQAQGSDDEQTAPAPPGARKLPYIIMDRAEIAGRQMRSVQHALDLLYVTQDKGFVLLRAHGWDLGRLQEAWFYDEAKVREQCGLGPSQLGGPPAASSSSSTASGFGHCPICLQSADDVVALDCGHGFCQDCWQAYLHSQVDDGKAAVQARCPQHKCGQVVPMDLFKRFCDEARLKKYEEWRLTSYVDDNPSAKWCTNPAGCHYACEYQGGMDACEIRCTCGFAWCWACGEEAHQPADCKLVNQWNTKNSAESENISWIRANTKNCPKCHKPIEKNQGCNHMLCSKAGGCGYEFCWLCLGDWSKHGTMTGGFYQCNIYDKQAKEGKHVEEEKTRHKAKHALEKYMFYFERFMDHDRGMKLTVREEQDIEEKVQKLHNVLGFEIIELQFLYDALRQVRACRRVLKWTYVYRYYLNENEPEKNLFEHLQKNLEEKTDFLHEKLEKDFDVIFSDADAMGTAEAYNKFMTFRSHVTNFTSVTQKFRDQILSDLGFGGRLTVTGGAAAASSSLNAAPLRGTRAFERSREFEPLSLVRFRL